MSGKHSWLVPILMLLISLQECTETSGSEKSRSARERIALSTSFVPTIESGDCGEHSFLASIEIIVEKREMAYCAGTLLHRYWVLTAAKCVKKFTTRPIQAIFGLHNDDFVKPFPVRILNKFLKIHPHYNGDQNDIALLKLASPLENVGLVVIPRNRSNDEITDVCEIGLVMGLEEDRRLNCLRMASINLTTCRTVFSEKPHIWDMQFCLQGVDRAKESCPTQTGGPFMCRGMQYGILSQGSGCGEKPAVYTRIDHYLDFIRATINGAQKVVGGGFLFGVLQLLLYLR